MLTGPCCPAAVKVNGSFACHVAHEFLATLLPQLSFPQHTAFCILSHCQLVLMLSKILQGSGKTGALGSHVSVVCFEHVTIGNAKPDGSWQGSMEPDRVLLCLF